jgi:hypothetical protein
VKRTFSDFHGHSTGLPGLKTHQAGGQDFGDFSHVIERLRGHVVAKREENGGAVQKNSSTMN